MGFWKKLKKLKFWKKRKEHGSKGESSTEDIATIFLTHIQKLQKQLEEMDANMEQVEATHRGKITELEEKCAAEHRQMEQMKTYLCIYIYVLQEELEETNREKELVEAILLSQINEIKRNCKEAEADLCSQIDGLKNANKEAEDDWKKREGSLRDEINKLKKRIRETERDKENVEHTLRSEMEELKATPQKRDTGSMERTILRGMIYILDGLQIMKVPYTGKWKTWTRGSNIKNSAWSQWQNRMKIKGKCITAKLIVLWFVLC